ncbi:RNA polymerase ECF-type sigma factor [Fulvivirga imtechensis AK7]|uniref:RNA polymerase ECF-type sigma factor n=1 Tax=Fulvivirga imtechensis AK7 TaxID=1237149 RepID=L8JR32_9BACT|nr:RNA polymerase sigma factor [Fulvivirga imtechensis]ELR69792.1 RNA polymerase ECF-type sigma factor [Fulvivirga imtechensis AK7]
MEPGQQTIHKYLVQRSQRGDKQAQNELYKLYARAMYNICRRMTGNDEDAKDVLQEAFITAFTMIRSLKNEATFSAWVKRIVINHCLNHLKKKRLATVDIADSDNFQEDVDSDQDYAQYESRRILEAIDQISDGCKTVLNLYLFEGYDHKEIGQILGITESASKAQYSKAKSKIRKILDVNRRIHERQA